MTPPETTSRTGEGAEADAGVELYGSPEELPDPTREALGDLLLVLADAKRVLGIHYADWILGSPTLEAGIACSAMAQDEWGHGRVLYAMLDDFGYDPDRLEHERGPSEYRSPELLDEPTGSWPDLLALNLLLDTALTVQIEAMRESRLEQLHHRVTKILDEERFHFEHARGWTARLASAEKGREATAGPFREAWRACLRWFGRGEDAPTARLVDEGIVSAGPSELRRRWVERVAPSVVEVDPELAKRVDGSWRTGGPGPDWEGWDPRTRRLRDAPGPDDEEILARVRGDKNRSLLEE